MAKQKNEPAAQQFIDDLLNDQEPGSAFGGNSSDAVQPPMEDRTLKIVLPLEIPADDQSKEKPSEKPARVSSNTATEIRLSASANHQASRPLQSSVAVSSNHGGYGGALSATEASLKQSESLRIAQGRLTEMEAEIERLRRENEKLATAGETLRRRADELLSKTELQDLQLRDKEKTHAEERKVMRSHLNTKERDLHEQRRKLDELEQKLESNFKKIRVRERDLEHRLEIAKLEHATIVSAKDKMVLDLKRQVDQLVSEADYSKSKSHELYTQFKGKQETIGRVVRALRIALSILEGEDDVSGNGLGHGSGHGSGKKPDND